jgi:hypothetical protein
MKTTMTKALLIAALFGITFGAKAKSSTVKNPSEGIKLSIGAEAGLGLTSMTPTKQA